MAADKNNTFATRETLQAFRAASRPPVEFFVPEWQTTVRLRVMSGTDRDAFEVEISPPGKNQRLNLANIRAKLVARCLVDGHGDLMFDPRSPDDIGFLGSLDAAGLNRVFVECQRINGLTEQDINDLAGNSNGAPNVNSGSN